MPGETKSQSERRHIPSGTTSPRQILRKTSCNNPHWNKEQCEAFLWNPRTTNWTKEENLKNNPRLARLDKWKTIKDEHAAYEDIVLIGIILTPSRLLNLDDALQYLTFTRPDVSFAVQQVNVSSTAQLTAYRDADRATLSRSSDDAEYQGLTNVVSETAWVRNVLHEFRSPVFTATLFYYDNMRDMGMREKMPAGLKFALRMKTKHEVVDDGFKWRKYGKKVVKSSPHPRNYFKCSVIGCNVKKRIQRDVKDSRYVITTYEGVHDHKVS
ncbi:probable WRKY transcription factor 51 [Tanacetum coccineum]